jgi:MoaA/NifB/PqqE/SkfB family radical SAM enzyme
VGRASAVTASPRRVLTLLLEMRCNSFCVFCGAREVDEAVVRSRRRLGLATPETKFGALRGRHTLASACAQLDRGLAEGMTELSIQGGEPTLFPELPQVVAHARDVGFEHVGIVTNGRRLADRGFAERLLEARPHAVTVSLLGADAATHDALQAVPGAFDETTQGIANVASVARERGLTTTINVNLILSAKSLGGLSDAVRLAARLGASAGAVHLLRFRGLAADPGVREPLRFDARLVSEALRGAIDAGRGAGLRVHAPDVPLCLHPELEVDAVRRASSRASVDRHSYLAAAFEYDLGAGSDDGGDLAPCAQCLLADTCPRVASDYLFVDPAEVLTPLTSERTMAWLDAEVVRLDPRAPGSVRRLQELGAVVDALEDAAKRPGALEAARERVREALADVALMAAVEGRMHEALPAVLAFVGVDPPEVPPPGRFRSAEPLAKAPAGGAVLELADGYAAWLQGERAADGTFVMKSVQAVAPPPTTPRQALLGRLFATAIAWALGGATRVRLAGAALQVLRDGAWVTVLVTGASTVWLDDR